MLQREKELEYRIFDGRKSLSISLSDVRVGDVIEYAYSVRGVNPAFENRAFGRFDLQWTIPADRVYRKLTIPRERDITLHRRNGAPAPVISERGGYKEYVWDIRDREGLSLSAESPDWYDPYPAVYWSEFKDWEAVARWATKLFWRSEELGPSLLAEVERIRSASSDPAEQLRLVLQFAQGQIRYLGVEIGAGSYVPSPPATVFERRFGDCKDKTLLMVSMLRALEIEAWPVLVNTYLQQSLRELPPIPAMFNHAIVLVRIKGTDYWLDPTRPRQDAKLHVLVQPDFGLGLVIADGTRDLSTMDVRERNINTRKVSSTLNLRGSIEKPVSLVVTTEVIGIAAEKFRSSLSTTSLEELQKSYLNFYARHYPKISPSAPLAVKDAAEENRITVTESYEIADFWQPQEKSRWFNANVHLSEVEGFVQKPRDTIRNAPLAMRHPFVVMHSSEISLPERWPIKPDSIVVDDTAFRFERRITNVGALLSISDKFSSKADTVTIADTPRYIANVQKVRDESIYALRRTDTARPANPFEARSWKMVLFAAIVFVAAAYAAFRLYRYDPPPRRSAPLPEIRSIRGWLLLAAVSVVIAPIRTTVDLIKALPAYFGADWSELTTATSAEYHPLWAPTLAIEMAANIVMLALVVLLLITFFQRRRIVPYLIVAVYVGNLAANACVLWLVSEIPEELRRAYDTDFPRFAGLIIGLLIWGSYFFFSSRARATFVRTYQRAPEKPQQVNAEAAVSP